MQINVNQIASAGLNSFITNSISGATFSGCLVAYYNSSGYFGPYLISTTGGAQSVNGLKSFLDSIQLPITNQTGNGVNYLQVLNTISGAILSLSGYNAGFYVSRILDESVTGIKRFVSSPLVPLPTTSTQATNVDYVVAVSGVLQNFINTLSVANVVYQTGDQLISGNKTFINSPLVPTPTDNSGAVPLGYLSSLNLGNVAYTNQSNTFTQPNSFTNTVTVPIGVASNSPITVAQLNAAVIAGGSTGNGLVTSINGISGSVFIDGQGTITIYECSGVIYASGNTANNTQLYSAKIPLSLGATGIQFIFGTGYNYTLNPSVVGDLEYTGSSSIAFIKHTIYGVTTTGFSAAFESGIPANYLFDVNVIPFSSGQSGFLGIQGVVGRNGASLNARGAFSIGQFYNPLDYVFTSNNVSYACISGNISSSFNSPIGLSGNSFWQVLASGAQGPSGSFAWQGTYDNNKVYFNTYATYLSGSTYSYTGQNPISGISPSTLTGGWTYLVQQPPVSIFYNSGIITGNFTTISFFQSPCLSGVDLCESFCSQSFILTGYYLSAVVTGAGPVIGTNGALLSGNIYQRNSNNDKIILEQFTFNSGQKFFFSGSNISHQITGSNRIGIDILNTLSGIDKFSVAVAGF